MIEALTYRMGGHSTSDDPSRYRSNEELAAWRTSDPLARLRCHLEKKQLWGDAAQQKLEDELERQLRDAVAAAESTPPPSLESLFQDVYQELPWHLTEQRAELLAGPRAPSAHT